MTVQSRGEAMGLFDGSANPRGTEWDRIQNRLPGVPEPVVSTPATDEAVTEAAAKYAELDDLITSPDAYALLTREPEDLADERYRKSLKAGEKSPRYAADDIRRQRVELLHKVDVLLPEVFRACQQAKKVIREQMPEAAKLAAAEYAEAREEYQEAWAALQVAKARYAKAADTRAAVLAEGGDGETSVVNLRTMLRQVPVSRPITGPAHEPTPGDAIREVESRFRGLELPDPTKVGTARPVPAAGESASFDSPSRWVSKG